MSLNLGQLHSDKSLRTTRFSLPKRQIQANSGIECPVVPNSWNPAGNGTITAQSQKVNIPHQIIQIWLCTIHQGTTTTPVWWRSEYSITQGHWGSECCPTLVLATGPGNPPKVQVWTAKTGRLGSRPNQNPTPLTLREPNLHTDPSTSNFRNI